MNEMNHFACQNTKKNITWWTFALSILWIAFAAILAFAFLFALCAMFAIRTCFITQWASKTG